MQTQKISRNSRWTRDPVLDEGKPAVARLTERDIEIFKLLTRYRYLPADYIHGFIGGDYKSLIHRLNLLCRKPNLFINRPHQQRENADANYRRLVYELDDRGAQVLRDRGMDIPKPKYRGNFAHELMICQIAASLELGQTDQVRLIQWPAILTSDRFPAATRQLPSPATIPVAGDSITADWKPFVVSRQFDTQSFIFCPGFEADCGTEPIDATDTTRSSIKAKFKAYLTIMEQRIYRAHFGANTFMVPFITTNASRMNSMMALLERMQPGEHAKRFLFKHIPSFTSFEKPPPANGHMLSEPWQRVGHKPFGLMEM